MKLVNDFIENVSFEDRKREVKIILEKYPNKIPIVVLFSKDIPIVRAHQYVKYLLSNDLKIGYLTSIIRKNINIDSRKGIFLLSENGSILPGHCEVMEFYDTYKNEDGYLYVNIYMENTLG